MLRLIKAVIDSDSELDRDLLKMAMEYSFV